MLFKAKHLFFILLAILLLTCLGNNIVEGMDNVSEKPQNKKEASTNSVNVPQDNNAVLVKGPNSQTIHGTPENTIYGVTRDQIPSGDEDLYILKSEVVPPVCPACPQSTACPREKPCPACPPCARCPEPAFECKKVPNYTSQDNRYLPKPLLNDFSTF